MTRRKAEDPSADAEAAMLFLEIAAEAKQLGEKDIAVMALKRARIILRRKLIEEEEE